MQKILSVVSTRLAGAAINTVKLSSSKLQTHKLVNPSACSQLCQEMVFGISLYYKTIKICPERMNEALKALTEEVPILTGRIKRPQSLLATPSETRIVLDGSGFDFQSIKCASKIENMYQSSLKPSKSYTLLNATALPHVTNCIGPQQLVQGRRSLFAAELLDCDDGTVLNFTMSHILCDASRAIKLLERLSEIYSSLSAGTALTAEGWRYDSLFGDIDLSRSQASDAETPFLSVKEIIQAPVEIFKYTTIKFKTMHVYVPLRFAQELQDKANIKLGKSDIPLTKMDIVQALISTLILSLRRDKIYLERPDHFTINIDLTMQGVASSHQGQPSLGNGSHILEVHPPPQGESHSDHPDFYGAIIRHAMMIRKAIIDLRSDEQYITKCMAKHVRLSRLSNAAMMAAFITKGNKNKISSTTATASFSIDSIKFENKSPEASLVWSNPRFDWWTIIQNSGNFHPYKNGYMCSMTVEESRINDIFNHSIFSIFPEVQCVT